MTQQPLSPEESARFQAVVEADAKQAAARASADALRIGADRDADVARLRAWQELVVATTAILGAIGLAALRMLPVEVTSNIITAVTMALVMRSKNGNGGSK